MQKILYYGLLLISAFAKVYATDLIDIYQHALENDPTFKTAYDTYMSDREAIPIARSVLYPHLTTTAYVGRSYEDVSAADLRFLQTYSTNQWQVSATQFVFNYKAWASLQQAKSSVKASHARFNDAAQDLILRTAEAYFDILFAKDTLNFAEAKKRANKRQLEQADQRFKVGLDTITSVYEAKAAYDQSVAEVISARNNQINQNENLRKLTNHVYEYLSPLRDSRIPLITPEPDNVNEWIDTCLRQNYKLYASKYTLEAMRDNIKVKAAGGWPTLQVQGGGSQTHNSGQPSSGSELASSFFVPAKQSMASVGVALNFPVMQGGLVQAETRQAQHDFAASSEQFEKTYREVTVNSRIAFNTIKDGMSKVKADRQTLISQQNSLESTEAQFQVGTRTMVDVVNAQERLFDAQRQLAKDQYDLIMALLQLKYFAGTLNVNDIEEVNSWLATTRINAFPRASKTRHSLKHTAKKAPLKIALKHTNSAIVKKSAKKS